MTDLMMATWGAHKERRILKGKATLEMTDLMMATWGARPSAMGLQHQHSPGLLISEGTSLKNKPHL
eukprot:scaffold200757_cov17-Tisochrysis_lutea.AAC.1